MHFSQKSIEMLAERDYTFWKIKQSSTIKNHFIIFPIAHLIENLIHLPKLKYIELASRKTLSYEKVNN